VVAHQLSAIAVQAGAARFASADDPHVAVAAVAAIEQGVRDELAELNTLVRRLRQSGAADQRASAQPRLEDVGGLIERTRESGLRAELLVDGAARPLADAVELAGFRVVQESLTNASAPGCSAGSLRPAAGSRASSCARSFRARREHPHPAGRRPAGCPGGRHPAAGNAARLRGCRRGRERLAGPSAERPNSGPMLWSWTCACRG